MRVLITGATGIVGRKLTAHLRSQNFYVRTTNREIFKDKGNRKLDSDNLVYFDLDIANSNYDALLDGIDAVVHLAARVHQSHSRPGEEDRLYKKTNVLGTEKLVREAVKRNVKRFIFLSSVKVNGEYNFGDKPENIRSFKESDCPKPMDAYGRSKHEAELIISKVCSQSDTEFIILRAPLLYGPGVKANFLLLLNIVNKSIPLPLKSIDNRRSLLYVDNLIDAIVICLKHPNVANKTYFVKDVDVSTPELINKIAVSLERKAVLFSFPKDLLRMMGAVIGKKGVIDRVTRSLLIDDSLFLDDTAWVPPFSFDEGLKTTVAWYLAERDT